MKKWDEMTPAEQEDEMGLVIQVDTSEIDLTDSLSVSLEASLLLSRYPVLLGFYTSLRLLLKQQVLNVLTQEEIAKFLHLSRPSYNQYRDSLEKLKLISVIPDTHNWRRKIIKFNYISPITKEMFERRFKTHGKEPVMKWLETTRESLRGITHEEMAAVLKVKEKEEEQKQSQLFVNSLVKEGVQKELKKQAVKKKAEEQKFPLIDYKSVLDGYRKYKGVYIKPSSPDEGRYRKAAKNMFLSGWKVFDILQCMKFFNEHCKQEGYEWMQNWTLETVGKKIGEFKAGSLKRPELGDDLPEYTG